MNNKSVYQLLLIVLFIQSATAIDDSIKRIAQGAGCLLIGLAVGTYAGKQYEKQSLDYQKEKLDIDQKNQAQKQQYLRQQKQQSSKDTVQQCSNRYKGTKSLKEQALDTGKFLFKIVQDATDDHELLLSAQLNLEDEYEKSQCISLLNQLSEKIRYAVNNDKHHIDQSREEFKRLQQEEHASDILSIEKQKRRKELEILSAQLQTERTKKDVYDNLTHCFTADVLQLTKDVQSLKSDVKNMQTTTDQQLKQLNTAANNTAHDVQRVSQMQRNALELFQSYLIMIFSGYHTNGARLHTIASQNIHNALGNVGFYKHYADAYFNPGATAPEHP